MSLRLPEESLEPGITEILSGIESFSIAVAHRYSAVDPFSEDHLEDLSDLDIVLAGIKLRLNKLRRGTW